MVIESLKAAQTALKEAMKDKDMSEATKKKLGETDAALQKLLDKAQEAAKTAKSTKSKEAMDPKEKEAGYAGEEEEGKESEGDVDMPEEGHTVTVTKKVKHDGPKDEKDDEDEDEDSTESKRGYIESLLKEAGIPKEAWSLDKLTKLSLKEAKEAIAEKKALIETARKSVSKEVEMIDLSGSEPLHESTEGEKGNLNGLFTGCAQ